jgi:predicted anti-sigma-YlaC factor YlaD
MNCAAVQRRLLQIERPERPPAALRHHLARCARCRHWQRRLLRLEANVPRLPVPPSGAPAKLLQEIRKESGRARTPGKGRPRALQALAVAAAVLLVVFGWWALWGWQN